MTTLSLAVKDNKIQFPSLSHTTLVLEYTEGLYDDVTIEQLVEVNRKDVVPVEMKNLPKLCRACKVRPPSKKIRGIPISTSYLEDGRIRYIVEPGYCCYGCAYRTIIDIVSRGPMASPPRYHCSESLLHCMFATEFPGCKLVPCPSWTEHKKNGGTLDDTKFYPSESNGKMNYTNSMVQKEVVSRGYVVVPVVNT